MNERETRENCLFEDLCENRYYNAVLNGETVDDDPCCTETGIRMHVIREELGQVLFNILQFIDCKVYRDVKGNPLLREEEVGFDGKKLHYSIHPFQVGVLSRDRVKTAGTLDKYVFPTFLGALFHDKGEDCSDCLDLREKFGKRLKTRGGFLSRKKDKATMERIFCITEQFRGDMIQYLLDHDFKKLNGYASAEELYVAASFAADMTRLEGLKYEDRQTKLDFKKWIRARTFIARLRQAGADYALPLAAIMSEDLLSNIFTYSKTEQGLAKALTRFDEQLWFEKEVFEPKVGMSSEYIVMKNALPPVSKSRIISWYESAMSREELEADAKKGLVCPRGYQSMQDVLEDRS